MAVAEAAVVSTAVVAEAVASTAVVGVAAVSTAAVVEAAAFMAARRQVAALVTAVGCMVALGAARITIPVHPIAIPVLDSAGLTQRWAAAPATAIAPAIVQA